MLQARGAAAAARNPLSWGASAAAGPHHISIDSNGNLTQKIEGSDTWTYEWDAENQLKRVLKNSVEQARFAYDPLGRRVEKVAGGVTTTYVYNEEDLLREQTSTGTSSKYIHTDLIDEPLAKEDSTGALTYFHLDGLSSVIKATDASGAVTGSYRYDAFGNVQQGTPSPFGFTGREPNVETGLVYMRARYYDPKIGRFISEDPIGFQGGINFFAYVGNNPVNLRDPYGLLAARTSVCAVGQFNHWFARGDADGWRYAHCMAACEARKCGWPQIVVRAAGWGNELDQAWECLSSGRNCHSAMSPTDDNDNQTGFTCPAETTCEDRCADLHGRDKDRNQFGPLFRFRRRR